MIQLEDVLLDTPTLLPAGFTQFSTEGQFFVFRGVF